ncbi:unnamed protein product [Blepharisma stoltei]|uniref:PAS domain-containing protein n=1 Tax=Blepharisma stoltei TaxID=1481888 RepID=A0AAU9IJR1_9CILI|nr:unnamed protein product [Blepharisma stoltei]
MRIKNDEGLTQEIETFENTTKIPLREKLKLAIFSYLGVLFKVKYQGSIEVKTQIFIEVIISVIISLQLIFFAWFPSMGISGWNSCSGLWIIAGYFNFDSICGNNGWINYCFYGTISAILLCLGCLILIAFFQYFKHDIPILIVNFTRWIVSGLTTILFIPSNSILFVVFKYSTFDIGVITEYTGNASSDSINYGAFGAFLSILFVILLMSIAIINEILTSDIKHHTASRNIRSKASSSLIIHGYYLSALSVFCYTIVGVDLIFEFRLVLFLHMVAIFINIYKNLPCYNYIGNVMHGCKLLSVAWVMIVFDFGTLLDDALMITILNIILQPVILTCTALLIRSRALSFKTKEIQVLNQYDFELKMRHILGNKSYENKIDIVHQFSFYQNNYSFSFDRLFIVWQTNYCFHIVKDESLARVKLSKIKEYSWSLEGEIQEWRIYQDFDKNKNSTPQELKFLEYLLDLNKIKIRDERLCYILFGTVNEITSRSSNVNALYKKISILSDSINDLDSLYKKITTNCKHAYAYELYASFLQTIMQNSDQANLMRRRKETVKSIDPFLDEEKRLAMYDEDNGMILISLNSESFGSIFYINEKAAKLLETTITDGLEAYLSDFIPEPFNINHNERIKKFLKNCDNVNIGLPMDFFLMSRKGYLVECNMFARLAAFKDSIYILLSLRPKKFHREMAFISEEGFIYNHTQEFAVHLGYNLSSVKGQFLSNLIPHLDLSSIPPFKIISVILKKKEIFLVYSARQWRNSKFFEILLIEDDEEINLWKSGYHPEKCDSDSQDTSSEEMENYKNEHNTLRINETQNSICFEVGVPLFKTEPKKRLDETGINNIDNKNSPNDERIDSNPQTSSQSVSTKHFVRRVIQEYEKAINIFQKILFIMIIAIAGTNIGILIYIYKEVDHTASLQIFENGGQMVYDLSSIADTLISFEYHVQRNESAENEIEDLTLILGGLLVIQNKLLKELSDWDYCPASKIVTESEIPVWMISPSPFLVKSNLYDVISLFITYTTKFLEKASKSESYSDELKFLQINSLTFTYQYTISALNALTLCESNRIYEQGLWVSVMTFISIGILMLCLAGLIWYIWSLNNKNNSAWNAVKRESHLAYVEFVQACIDRLLLIHNNDDLSFEDIKIQNKSKNNIKKLNTRIYLRFYKTLSVFLFLSFVFYMIIEFWLYSDCKVYMNNRPKLLENFGARLILTTRMSFFAKECHIPNLIENFESSYDFQNLLSEIYDAADQLKQINERISDNSMQDLISDELKVRLYEHTNSNKNILKYGTVTAIEIIIYESYNVATSEKQALDINTYEDYIKSIEKDIMTDFLLSNRDSKNKITHQLDLIFIVTIFYSSISVLMYFIYYWPFLNSEKLKMQKLQLFSTVVPGSHSLYSQP